MKGIINKVLGFKLGNGEVLKMNGKSVSAKVDYKTGMTQTSGEIFPFYVVLRIIGYLKTLINLFLPFFFLFCNYFSSLTFKFSSVC